MSQSPESASTLEPIDRYMQGWKALNRLLHEDRSFSGRERNCAWLNTGGGKFADISSLSGFDFPDDARGLCTADWDFDGDVDLWVSNRTAPRLRLLRNDCADNERFIAFKLQGDGVFTNRDAIGAVLRLHLAGETPAVLAKTLTAGEGFLSQSSRWVHFGVGQGSTIEKLVVDWPGGNRQTIDQLQIGKFYRVEQDGGARIWSPPNAGAGIENTASLPLPKVRDDGRIVLTSRLPMPKLHYVSWGGTKYRCDFAAEGPVAINLWASWCAPCQKELALWRDHESAFREARLNVLALCVDELETSYVASTKAQATVDQLHFALPTGRATKDLLDDFDVMQRAVLDRWLPLPLPCTFLVDRRGELVAIYKGPVHPNVLIKDMQLLSAPEPELLNAVAPLEGRWMNRPAELSPITVASLMLDNGRAGDAIAYLADRDKELDVASASPAARLQAADLNYTLGLLLLEDKQHTRAEAVLRRAAQLNPQDVRVFQLLGKMAANNKDFNGAAEQYRHALSLDPDNVALHHKLGMIRGAQGRHNDAVEHMLIVARANPENANVLFQLATALLGAGDARRAIAGYRRTLELQPNMPLAMNNLAWVLATHPDENVRNGGEAVALAEKLCALTKFQQPRPLATLAAALAEAGDFDQAVERASRAIELFVLGGDTANAEATKAQLQLYRDGKPYRGAGAAAIDK